ncbi:hypothetical protein VHEMI06076 [[Torrubiella] hemipterigena]|uniref:Peptidase A1 domain-containing protein n=1 Tax=[Torrubiella] hemipterigena TaxID=1531966 RepID=A0A0A1TIL0_9HYPO|nr:hypothetical protein VHEMI06076 [[Torrubiella] hemipterigena]
MKGVFANVLLAATATAGFVSLDLSKEARSVAAPQQLTSRTHTRELERRKITEGFFFDSHFGYMINVEFGTPPQKVALLVDTGANDIYPHTVKKSSCDAIAPCPGLYNPNASSTYAIASGNDLDGKSFFRSFTPQGSLNGNYVKDVVSVGSAKVQNQVFGALTDTWIRFNIFGLAPTPPAPRSPDDAEYSSHVSFLDNLYRLGSINRRLFSLYLAGGSLLLGAVDTAKYYDKLVPLPMAPVSSSKDGHVDYRVQLYGLTMPGLRSALEFEETDDFLLASGADGLYLPPGFSKLGPLLEVFSDTQFGNLIDCDIAKKNNLTMQFKFVGLDITVPGSSLVGKRLSEEQIAVLDPKPPTRTKEWNSLCPFKVREQYPKGPPILGIPFLENTYAVFDQESRTVALAQAKFNEKNTKIVEDAKSNDFLLISNEPVPQSVRDGSAVAPRPSQPAGDKNGKDDTGKGDSNDKSKDNKNNGAAVRVCGGVMISAAAAAAAIHL